MPSAELAERLSVVLSEAELDTDKYFFRVSDNAIVFPFVTLRKRSFGGRISTSVISRWTSQNFDTVEDEIVALATSCVEEISRATAMQSEAERLSGDY